MSVAITPAEAKTRQCVWKNPHRGSKTLYRYFRNKFLWTFFPWYSRYIRWPGEFCQAQGCMNWEWEDDGKKRGRCGISGGPPWLHTMPP